MNVHVCPYVYVMHLYVLYDYVQHCKDTTGVELLVISRFTSCKTVTDLDCFRDYNQTNLSKCETK